MAFECRRSVVCPPDGSSHDPAPEGRSETAPLLTAIRPRFTGQTHRTGYFDLTLLLTAIAHASIAARLNEQTTEESPGANASCLNRPAFRHHESEIRAAI